jgi:hypothetical protein
MESTHTTNNEATPHYLHAPNGEIICTVWATSREEARAQFRAQFPQYFKSPEETKTLTTTLEDGRVFPQYNGEALCWDIGAYGTWNEEKTGYPRMRAVIRAMMVHRPEQVERERREMLRASFNRMFGRNAAKVLAVIEEEMAK